MNLFKKLNIRIRGTGHNSNIEVHAAEKGLFLCKTCHNKYYEYHLFCPQCLGEVQPNQSKPSQLMIQSVPNERRGEIAQLLADLSAQQSFPFNRALSKLPWQMAYGEFVVLEQWRRVLEAEKVEAGVQPAETPSRKRLRSAAPLFSADATPPFLVPPQLIGAIREVGPTMRGAGLKLKWADYVLKTFAILDIFYKHDPSRRILFEDFLMDIKDKLSSCVQSYNTVYKTHEGPFAAHLDQLMASLAAMQKEMDTVRRKVEEQL